MQFRYFRPKSLTWWAGAFSMALGVLMMAGAGSWATDLGEFISILSGGQNASPAGLMSLGAGLIGIRDKLARVFEGVPSNSENG